MLDRFYIWLLFFRSFVRSFVRSFLKQKHKRRNPDHRKKGRPTACLVESEAAGRATNAIKCWEISKPKAEEGWAREPRVD